jgi:hypothetical protein
VNPLADALAVATALARALDADDFVAAQALLASDCAYDAGAEVLVGPEAIVASYAENSRWARTTIENVRYESSVTAQTADTSAITYSDILDHRGEHHVHRCRQHVTIGPDGRVVAIRHEDLPGESEALDAFFARCGIARPAKKGA